MLRSIILLVILWSQASFAGVIDTSKITDSVIIENETYIIHDQTWELSIEEVQDLPLENYELISSGTPNFGFKPYPFWARIDLKNPTQETQNFLLKYDYSLVDHLDLYSPNGDGTFSIQMLGDRTPYDAQEVHSRVPIFRIVVPPGSHSYFMRLETLGSNVFPLTLYQEESLQQDLVDEYLILAILLGIIMAITGYNMFLLISFRTPLYFYYVLYMFTCLLYLFGVQGVSRMYFATEDAYHWLSNEGILVNSELYNMVMILFTIEFLNLKEKMPRFAKFFSYYRILQVINILLVQFYSYELGAKTTVISVLFTMTCMSYAGIRSVMRGYRPAYFYSLAFCLVLFGNIIIAMKYRGYLPFNTFTNWTQIVGVAAEALLLSLALGDRVNFYRAKSEAKINALNEELKDHIQNVEQIVEDKTRDIKSMMANIPQGIFTIHPSEHHDDGGIIDKDYSAWLEQFLNKRELADVSVMTGVFDRSTLGKDEKNRIAAILFSCLGDDDLAYEANADGLPSECTIHNEDGDRKVELDWSPMFNEDDMTVEKILVTLRDVTEINMLRARSERQEKDLHYLSEITKVDAQKFDKFMKIAYQFVFDNIAIAESQGSINAKAIETIYINLHTLKGISRTYGFISVSDLIHHEEEIYAILRSSQAENKISFEEAIDGQERIKGLLDIYQDISESVLGRKKNESILQINKQFVKTKLDALTKLNLQQLPEDSRNVIISLKNEFASFFFHDINTIFDDLRVLGNTLAKDLKKKPPVFELCGDEVLFTQDGCDLLKQVFIHLIRNSMDHGVENETERIQAGKKGFGTIRIENSLKEDGLVIQYSDDGRGLDLTTLVKKAKDHGIITKEDQLSIDDKVNLMFESGVSTASEVTDISGRGVGMKAVKEFIHQAGGALTVHTDPSDQGTFVNFHFEIYLPYDYFRLTDFESAA